MLARLVGGLVRLPVTLLQTTESVLDSLSATAARAGRVLDAIEGLPERADAVVTAAAALTEKVDGVVAEAAETLAGVQPAVRAVAALEAELVSTLLADLALLVAGVRQLDPSLVDDASRAAHGLPQLLGTVDDRLLPALASLEQLVPVVAQLGVQVDHLDATVADVGALLGGIPGAARLLKRGETRPARSL